MKNYEVTLMATSYKKVEICADNERAAEGLAARMYHQTDMLNFTNEDVDELAVQATEMETPVDKLAMSAKDRMYMSLLRFCMEQTAEFDEEDIREMLDEIYWDSGFDPLLYWQFVPICGFEVDGTEEMSHTYRHNRLFGMNGYRLDSSVEKGTAAMSTVTESYELWLLEDMSLAVTFCCQMTVADRDGKYYETAEYRYPVTGSYAALTGDFYVEHFLESVSEQIYMSRNMD